VLSSGCENQVELGSWGQHPERLVQEKLADALGDRAPTRLAAELCADECGEER